MLSAVVSHRVIIGIVCKEPLPPSLPLIIGWQLFRRNLYMGTREHESRRRSRVTLDRVDTRESRESRILGSLGIKTMAKPKNISLERTKHRALLIGNQQQNSENLTERGLSWQTDKVQSLIQLILLFE